MKLRQKMLIFTAGLVTLVALALTGTAAYELSRFTEQAKGPAVDMQNDSLDQAAASAHQAMEALAESIQARVSGGLSEMEFSVKQSRGLTFSGEPVKWNAVNQFSKEAGVISLPAAAIGGMAMPQVTDFTEPLPLVDGLTKRIGGTYTLFQRMNQQGDMLRVATSVRTKEGKRGVGTYIPAFMPDGKPNPILASILKGEHYKGPAFVVDTWVQAEYRPVMGSAGQVIGMIYAGLAQQSSKSTSAYFQGGAVGDHGRLFAIKGKGADKGQFMVAPEEHKVGDSGLQILDKAGVSYLSDLADKAVASQHEEVLRY